MLVMDELRVSNQRVMTNTGENKLAVNNERWKAKRQGIRRKVARMHKVELGKA